MFAADLDVPGYADDATQRQQPFGWRQLTGGRVVRNSEDTALCPSLSRPGYLASA